MSGRVNWRYSCIKPAGCSIASRATVSAVVSRSFSESSVLRVGGFIANAADCRKAFALSANMTGRSRRGLESRGVGSCADTALSSLTLGWIAFLCFGGMGGVGYCDGSNEGLFGGAEGDWFATSSTKGAGAVQLKDGCAVLVDAESVDEDLEFDSEDRSGRGAETAVAGG